MPMLKAVLLLTSVIVCIGSLPSSRGYLDLDGESNYGGESRSMENEFPHSLRHQDHYVRHDDRGVKDLKKKPLKHVSGSSARNSSLSAHPVFLRHHHHGNNPTSTVPPVKAGHHLRHHNRHHESWQNRVFASSSGQQQNHVGISAERMNLSSTLQSRLFDRDSSLYGIPKPRTTTGPKSRHNYGSHIHDRTYADDNNHFDDRDDGDASKIEHPQRHSARNHSGRRQLHEDDYGEDDDDNDDADDYIYESVEEDEQDEDSTLETTKWNTIDNDLVRRREHHLSAKRWISSDDAESVYSHYNIPGTLTQQKFEELGTHEAVKQARKAHITNHKHQKALANAHAIRVYGEANCHLPQQRVERIQKDPSKIYVPHCTILHRCGDDTGCCKTDRQTCAPKRTQSVDLYFFVKSFNSKDGSIERHTFINHTECHCVDKNKRHHYSSDAPAPIVRKATILDCTCPKLFEKILQENGFCRCDCSSGNIGCNYLKRGMEHFSMVDRKCIIEGRCKPPTCEFGNYLKKHGRCQRNNEAIQNAPASWSYN